MPNNTSYDSTKYTKTYTAFAGADIVATFNGIVIGELQAVSYSISREKAPIYTLGSAEPRSFSRGKRGIAGSLVFTVFDRDALLSAFKSVYEENSKIQKFKTSVLDGNTYTRFMSVDEWDAAMTETISGGTGPIPEDVVADPSQYVQEVFPYYADELLPFDITITMANEYGQRAKMTIFGVELLNEGSGYSIDTVATEKAYTFVARRIEHLSPDDVDTAFFKTVGDVLSPSGENA